MALLSNDSSLQVNTNCEKNNEYPDNKKNDKTAFNQLCGTVVPGWRETTSAVPIPEMSTSMPARQSNEQNVFVFNNFLQELQAQGELHDLEVPIEMQSTSCNDLLGGESFSASFQMSRLPSLPPIGSPPTQIPRQCELHMETLQFVCECCKKLVCQYCTLQDHKDHSYTPIIKYTETAIEKFNAAIESSHVGTKCVKGSIDKAIAFSQAIEREAIEVAQNIKKSIRHYIIAAEQRERYLLEEVERLRQKKLSALSDQAAGLRSALAGLAKTSDMLSKAVGNVPNMDSFEIADKIIQGQKQIEEYAAMYKTLQPKEEFYIFIKPSFGLLQDIRMQGDVVLSDKRFYSSLSCYGSLGATSTVGGQIMNDTCMQLPLSPPCENIGWEQGSTNYMKTPPPTVLTPVPRIGQCVPGSINQIKLTKSLIPSVTFCTDGHEDGQVSRPWGICVDKFGQIIVSDRRNHRIQIFNSDGTFKFKFGTRGDRDGEFDLPAGICTDSDAKIIVVDKDNHRVQTFSPEGVFLHKFGCFGKECGQFQYPWDIAINSSRQLLVTDSRNRRIQLFDAIGRFLRLLDFDHYSPGKGPASPRGCCFTPLGDIIVSDFDNHCLLLIDADLEQIIACQGTEGNGLHQFNRPSGICCDDEGRIVVADSKNQRVMVFTPKLECLWVIEIRPSLNPLISSTLDEKDRPSDIAILPDGKVVVMIELSPDTRDSSNPRKKFVQVY